MALKTASLRGLLPRTRAPPGRLSHRQCQLPRSSGPSQRGGTHGTEGDRLHPTPVSGRAPDVPSGQVGGQPEVAASPGLLTGQSEPVAKDSCARDQNREGSEPVCFRTGWTSWA